MTDAPNSIQINSSQPALGQHTLMLVQWLSALHSIKPLPQLTLLGVGNGYSEVLNWAAEHAIENVSLVEASQQLFNQLSAKWQAAQPQWKLHNVVMDAGVDKADTFYLASNSTESGLLAPITFTPLWPNITEKESQPCEPVSLTEWASTHWRSPGQWLFINYFCEVSLLATQAAVFEKVDVLRLRVSTEKSVPQAITASEWEPALKQAGFRIISRESERHPGIERWLCVKDLNSESSADKAELAQTKAELEQVKEKLENTHNWFMNHKKQALEYEKQLAVTEDELKATKNELAQTRQQMAQIKLLRESVDQLSQKMTLGFTIQSEQRQQSTNALGKHITQMLQPSKVQTENEEKDNL